MTMHVQLIPAYPADAGAQTDARAYFEAHASATMRARHSYFDQHIVRDDDGHYWVADEGDYSPLPRRIYDRIVHTVDAGLSDEY
jgi:hypothetical protein